MPDLTDLTYGIEVLTLPVSDVDRARAFYADALGFALDVDWSPSSGFRVVQLTPPGSGCSIQFGVGVTDAVPGSARANYLVVRDIVATHEQLTERGVPLQPIRHKFPREAWRGEWAAGPDPERADYATSAEFADPDGNTWFPQERGHRGG